MRSKLLAVLVTAVLSIAGCNVQAQSSKTAIENVFENGLWICKTPVMIVGLQDKFVTTSQNGVKLTPTVTDQLVRAQNGDCERLDADNIKPIGSTGDFLLDASWSSHKSQRWQASRLDGNRYVRGIHAISRSAQGRNKINVTLESKGRGQGCGGFDKVHVLSSC